MQPVASSWSPRLTCRFCRFFDSIWLRADAFLKLLPTAQGSLLNSMYIPSNKNPSFRMPWLSLHHHNEQTRCMPPTFQALYPPTSGPEISKLSCVGFRLQDLGCKHKTLTSKGSGNATMRESRRKHVCKPAS